MTARSGCGPALWEPLIGGVRGGGREPNKKRLGIAASWARIAPDKSCAETFGQCFLAHSGRGPKTMAMRVTRNHHSVCWNESTMKISRVGTHVPADCGVLSIPDLCCAAGRTWKGCKHRGARFVSVLCRILWPHSVPAANWSVIGQKLFGHGVVANELEKG